MQISSNLHSNVSRSTRINSSSVHTYIFVCFTLRVILQGFVTQNATQLLQDPGYVEDIEDTLLHASWSVQVIRIILYIRLIIFQLNLSNVKDVKDCKTHDNKLHCIILSLLYLMSKTSEMHTNL